MPAVFNVRNKPRVDKDGIVQRQKYKDVLPLSMAYGLYLGDSVDKYGSSKAYFLMTSLLPGLREVLTPSDIRSSPANLSVSLEDFGFSKKFSIDDSLLETLVAGSEYWFLYTAEPVSKDIDGKMVTYESLDLVCHADIPGADGIKSLLPILKVQFKGGQQQPHS
jgi:hypothetical protein